MIYDQAIVEKHRQKAITSAEQLVPGETYWSSFYKDSFTFIKLLTTRESYALDDLTSSDESIHWMLTLYAFKQEPSSESLRDNNIGASYNPWLIFKNEQDMLDYLDEIKIRYSRDDYPDELDL